MANLTKDLSNMTIPSKNTMWLALTTLCTLLLSLSISSYALAQSWDQKVMHSGALKNAMRKGDLAPKIELMTLSGRKNLYALGALGYLKGEAQIFDSEPFSTYVGKEGKIAFNHSYTGSASILVYAQVPKWTEYSIPAQITSKEDFEKYLEKKASEHGLDLKKPFPFLLEGRLKSNSWHIINWNPADKIHTHQKHIRSGIHQMTKNMSVVMLGFFSKYHTGIFTHHTTNMHIHFTSADQKVAGHSDNMVLGKGVVLKLPTL
jgi:acetolactate decarboxylase